jgi:hypothetical protein
MLISEPTSFTAPQYGLLTSAGVTEVTPPGPQWKMGVVWEPLCPDVAGTYDPCTAVVPSGDGVTEAPAPVAKAPTFVHETQGATAFTAYAEIQCSAPGSWDQLPDWARLGLQRAEEQFVENAFWRGVAQSANGSPVTVFPHLAANAELVDGGDLLQPAATVVTAEPQLPAVGIGMLEQAMRDCYPGQATLHVPLRLGSVLAEHMNLVTRGGTATTAAGSLVILGSGYPGTAPDGTSTPTVTWVYATGPVFYARDNAVQFSLRDSLDRSNNTVTVITERTYVVGFSCCLLAIPILNGEIPA